jgi:tripartite-type tricarboxylate transporter receptor subunit TctC
MDEAGVKGFNLDAWAGLVAATGTRPEIAKKLNIELRKVIDDPDVQAKFKNVGFEGFSSTPKELGDYMKAQVALWGKMVKDAGIQPN